jgi:hypothetical protein
MTTPNKPTSLLEKKDPDPDAVSKSNLTLPLTEEPKQKTLDLQDNTLKHRKAGTSPTTPVTLIKPKQDIVHRSLSLYLLFHFNVLFFLIYIPSQTLTVYLKVNGHSIH